MKVFIAVVLLQVVGCVGNTDSDSVRKFIPGTYTRHYEDEYTNSFDTIQIVRTKFAGNDIYEIIKSSTFQKRTDNGITSPQKEIKNMPASYDEKTKSLWVESQGNRIYFDPNKSELKMGAQPYKKIQ